MIITDTNACFSDDVPIGENSIDIDATGSPHVTESSAPIAHESESKSIYKTITNTKA